MAKKKYAVICLDETGSMSGQEKRVTTSLNEYVNKLPKDAHVTIFKFDSERWETFYDGKKAKYAYMTTADYNPGAMTPLYDAVARSIKHAESLANEGDKVMVMIDTDGIENASKEHNQTSVKALVDARKEDGWEFLFMASGLDEAAARDVGHIGDVWNMNTLISAYSDKRSSYAMASVATSSYFNDENEKNWAKAEKSWNLSTAIKDKKTEPFTNC